MKSMKNKKIILSSILSLILCLSLILGSTYALFTSESKTNIAINSGNVKLVATLDNLLTYSITPNATNDGYDVVEQPKETFLTGGTAKIEGGTLTLDKMVPGDRATFDIVLENNSDVAIQYQTIIKSINDTGLFKGLTVTIENVPFDGMTITSAWTLLEANEQPADNVISVSVELPVDAGNDYQGKSTELAVAVNAVQGNALTIAPNPNTDEYEIYTADELVAFSNAVNKGNTFEDKTVKLMNNIDMKDKIYYPAGNVVSFPSVSFEGIFDGQGYTIDNLVVSDYLENDAAAGLFGSNLGTVKNVVLNNATVRSSHYAGGIVAYNYGTVDSCTVTNSSITSTCEILANGAYDNGDKVGGIVGYMANENTTGIINKCTVENTTVKGYRDIGGIVGYANANSTVSNNTVNGVTLTLDKTYNYKNYALEAEHDCGNIVGENHGTLENNTVDGVVEITTQDELDKAIVAAEANKETTIVLSVGEYKIFDKHSMVNKEITFKGTQSSILDATGVQVNYMQGISGATVTFDGVTVHWAQRNEGYQGPANAKKVIYNNCTITGTQFMYGDADFTNCTFINETGDHGYNVYGRDAGTLTFTSCTFNTAGRAIMLYQDQTTEVNVVMNDCIFNDNGNYSSKPKAVVETGDGEYKTSKFNITINNCTTNGFETNNSTSPMWGNKDSIPPERLKVTIDGSSINIVTHTETVSSATELTNVLNRAGEANADNTVINLQADINLTENWNPVTVQGYNGADVVIINGNGHTITGLTAPLFAGGFAGGSGIIINDLTIANSDIKSTNTLGSGAFIETIDSMDVITLNNCHVKDSKISGSRTGGLIGWNSGYNNTNDGAVKTYVTIKNCSVINCEITGDGTVGGIVGHAGANAWTYNTIENCTVRGCTLISNDDSYRVGTIVGTANVGEVTITNCNSWSNTTKQNNNGTEIARPEGQSELYGRFVPQNGSGKLTIDGVAIQ